MRSLFGKITIWSLVVIVLALVGVRQIAAFISGNAARNNLRIESARNAYESGGAKGLESYFLGRGARPPVDRNRGIDRFLVDANGKDLLDGSDRSELLKRADSVFLFFRSPDDPFITNVPSSDGKYNLVAVFHGPTPFTDSYPYYLLIVAVAVVFGYFLAFYFASPLKELRTAVDRFGHGDLSARVNSRRKDEIGDLARAFDKMAERTETLLTAERRLLQDISHELRSPLARLSFGVELARTAEDREAAIARIRKEVDRLTSLVGGLLQVTRAEGDPAQRNLEEVDLRELLTELADDCSIEAEKRHCEVVLDATTPVILLGDRELLRRAIENVLRNAIRYAPEGTAIEVKLQPNPEAASISIRDYGSGVPDDLLTEIFKPFFRVGQARDTASGGVGLGLAIAQRAVALHQGKMLARNVEPGLMVSVELPLHSAA